MSWTDTQIHIGDRLTFGGVYAKRTFWEWLMRKPRRLQQYVVTYTEPSDGCGAGA